MPSSPLRSRLRGHGHALDAIVRIGKAGVTRAITAHLTKVLFDHELVKVKLEAESPEDRYTVADQLAEQPGVNVVQIVGRTILLYKRHPQEPRFEGKRANPGDDAATEPGKEPGKNTGRKGGRRGGRKPDKNPNRNAGKQRGKKPDKNPDRNAGKKPDERSGNRPGPAAASSPRDGRPRAPRR